MVFPFLQQHFPYSITAVIYPLPYRQNCAILAVGLGHAAEENLDVFLEDTAKRVCIK